MTSGVAAHYAAGIDGAETLIITEVLYGLVNAGTCTEIAVARGTRVARITVLRIDGTYGLVARIYGADLAGTQVEIGTGWLDDASSSGEVTRSSVAGIADAAAVALLAGAGRLERGGARSIGGATAPRGAVGTGGANSWLRGATVLGVTSVVGPALVGGVTGHVGVRATTSLGVAHTVDLALITRASYDGVLVAVTVGIAPSLSALV